MAIDFTLTPMQKELQKAANNFCQNILKPIVKPCDAEPDPQKGFALSKEVYMKAYEMGFCFGFIPPEYGGMGAGSVDFALFAEEIGAVDSGFVTPIANALGLMPVIWWGSEKQKEKWLRMATSDPRHEFLVGYAVSEPGGTAAFDHPDKHPVGINVTADYDPKTDEYILNGRKMWSTNASGWDGKGADLTCVIARTDREAGGTKGTSAFMVERGTPGFIVEGILDKMGTRMSVQPRLRFENCRVPAFNLIEGTKGNGDMVVTKGFTMTGPLVGACAVGVMRAAFEFALEWSRTYTGGGSQPIIHHQNVGYMLTNMKMKIEAARYLAWRMSHYLDTNNFEGMEGSALAKIYCGELAVDVVSDAMRLVGINSYLKDYPLEKLMRDALVFPIYDAGNMGMQRRRVHGVMIHESYNPMSLAMNLKQPFFKEMHGVDSDAGHSVASTNGASKKD